MRQYFAAALLLAGFNGVEAQGTSQPLASCNLCAAYRVPLAMPPPPARRRLAEFVPPART